MSAYDFSFTSIKGTPLPLESFEGKLLLIVNTASACGLTPQYAGLQKLQETYAARGFSLLGVPCNDFGGQEPGSHAEIEQFCETRFSVDFPLTEKVSVIGASAHPFYQWVAKQLGDEAAPKWNFHKYLVGPDGALLGTFGSRLDPLSPELIHEIEQHLPQ